MKESSVEIIDSYNRRSRNLAYKIKPLLRHDYRMYGTEIHKAGLHGLRISAVVGDNIIWVYKKDFFEQAVQIAEALKVREVERCW